MQGSFSIMDSPKAVFLVGVCAVGLFVTVSTYEGFLIFPSPSVILSISKDILQVNKGKEKSFPIWERLVFAGVGRSWLVFPQVPINFMGWKNIF